jgi:phosphomannomutase
MNPSIFKAYDIRGLYPEEIDESLAEKVGNGSARYFKSEKIAIGTDHRTSSPSLKIALIKGITEAGVDVIDIGLVTTPAAYFASHKLQVPVIVITASHNPPEYNGMKFCLPNAVPVGKDTGLDTIRDLAAEGMVKTEHVGKVKHHSITDDYRTFLHSENTLRHDHKIVIDTASAMGIEDLPFWDDVKHVDVVGKLYASYKEACPHEANPMKPETLSELGAMVRETGADLGLAYDGDADRVGFTDELGAPIRADLISALIATHMLKKYPESKILVDVRASRALTDIIQKYGGTPQFTPVGHAKIKRLMKETGAVFAGELSSHFYYRHPYIAEMGPLPALHLLEIMEERKMSLSQLVDTLPKYAHSGEINFHVEDAPAIIARITEDYKDGIVNTLDGIRIDYPNWWFSVRASNTESLLRLNVEARTPSETALHVDEFTKLFASFGGAPAVPHAHSR